jgi:periplasmic protein TonB
MPTLIRSASAPNAHLAEPSKQDIRMALALLASAAVHGMVLSTQFVQINPRLFEDNSLPMEVVLVNAKSLETPLKPDALAQVSLAGGGNTDEDRRLKSPLPASPETRAGSDEAQLQARVRQLEEQAKRLLTQLQPEAQVSSQPEPQAPDRPAVDASQLNLQAREMAQLQARISQQWDEYQKRPKRAFVGANVREYAFARYVEDWVTKVERIGNLNYPEAARRQGIYGSLKLTVSIHANGQIEAVEVDRSSGSKILDAAAIRIVELAAPYAAFPDDMRKKADILSITRTWTFTRSDQLVTD